MSDKVKTFKRVSDNRLVQSAMEIIDSELVKEQLDCLAEAAVANPEEFIRALLDVQRRRKIFYKSL